MIQHGNVFIEEWTLNNSLVLIYNNQNNTLNVFAEVELTYPYSD